MIELAESSVIEHLTALEASGGLNRMAYRQAAQAQLTRVHSSQGAIALRLRTFDAAEIYRVQRVYNGIAVRVDPTRLDELLAMPDVKAIHPIIAKYPTHATSVPAIGAPALWSGLHGNLSGATGAGIRIAVIDTGIDYLHRDFGGPGSGYSSNDVTISGDVPGFPSAKVVGGYDFTGDEYNADPNDDDYQPFPDPDPDPYDCYAHGTHVAGTAAGYGVDRDGFTYRGPYTEALDLDEMIVAPGVAPEAQLYALKVFGCTGATELTDLAIEWAVDPNGDGDFSDRVDVINLSLGAAYGTRTDTTALAADRAAAAGVVVVASAGNSGSNYFVTGSPWRGRPGDQRGRRRIDCCARWRIACDGRFLFPRTTRRRRRAQAGRVRARSRHSLSSSRHRHRRHGKLRHFYGCAPRRRCHCAPPPAQPDAERGRNSRP